MRLSGGSSLGTWTLCTIVSTEYAEPEGLSLSVSLVLTVWYWLISISMEFEK
jgi:hypothetical protein